ncbi:MAG TPA: DUF3617 family protein [Burkholderiales bacterium]|jgi:hypothetical protein
MRTFVLALAIAVSGSALADIEPGNWEMTVSTQVEGIPAGALAPIVQTRCLTREDARDPSRLVGGAGCEFSDRRDTGSEMSFNVSCGGQLPMRGSGLVRYTSQSVDGSLELSAETGGQKIMTRSRVVGRRLGAC